MIHLPRRSYTYIPVKRRAVQRKNVASSSCCDRMRPLIRAHDHDTLSTVGTGEKIFLTYLSLSLFFCRPFLCFCCCRRKDYTRSKKKIYIYDIYVIYIERKKNKQKEEKIWPASSRCGFILPLVLLLLYIYLYLHILYIC